MSGEAERFLIELLRAETESAQAEVDSLRGSLRYRLGDLVLQAWPPSLRSLMVLPRIIAFYRTFRRNQLAALPPRATSRSVSHSFPSCPKVVYGATSSVHSSDDIWCTQDAALLVKRLDTQPAEQLILRELCESIVRRLARLQLQGCRIIWWPDPAVRHVAELEAYVVALADERREENAF